jgi:hypothetical protein
MSTRVDMRMRGGRRKGAHRLRESDLGRRRDGLDRDLKTRKEGRSQRGKKSRRPLSVAGSSTHCSSELLICTVLRIVAVRIRVRVVRRRRRAELGRVGIDVVDQGDDPSFLLEHLKVDLEGRGTSQ